MSAAVKKRKARALRKGLIVAGVEVDAPPRLGFRDEASGDRIEDGEPVFVCPSCWMLYDDRPTVKEAVCEKCERTLRRYACVSNPEAAKE